MPLVEWLRIIPDLRCSRAKPHEMAEIFVCIIMGLLNGKTKLRRIYRWCVRHIDALRRYIPFENGIPSVPTISRILASVDEELVSCACSILHNMLPHYESYPLWLNPNMCPIVVQPNAYMPIAKIERLIRKHPCHSAEYYHLRITILIPLPQNSCGIILNPFSS